MITGEKGEQEKRLRGKRGKRGEKERKEGRFRQNLVLKGIFFYSFMAFTWEKNIFTPASFENLHICMYVYIVHICEREKKYITIQYNDKTIKRNKPE